MENQALQSLSHVASSVNLQIQRSTMKDRVRLRQKLQVRGYSELTTFYIWRNIYNTLNHNDLLQIRQLFLHLTFMTSGLLSQQPCLAHITQASLSSTHSLSELSSTLLPVKRKEHAVHSLPGYSCVVQTYSDINGDILKKRYYKTRYIDDQNIVAKSSNS